MILVALDTSEKSQVIAVLRSGQVLGEYSDGSSRSHSETLLPNLMGLLEDCGLHWEEVEVLAVTAGPGSFTGLRIALSTVKALAYVKDLPVVAVGTLAALAAPYLIRHHRVAACLDAKMGQVYGAIYGAGQGGIPKIIEAPRAWPVKDYAEKIKAQGPGVCVVGSGLAAFPQLETEVSGDPLARVQGGVLGGLAWEMYKTNDFIRGFDLSPRYLRRTKAEEDRMKREGLSAKNS